MPTVRKTFDSPKSQAFLALVAILCVSASSLAQQARPAGGQTQIVIPVAPSAALDSKKLKVGDQVEFKTLASLDLPKGGQIPRGAKVTGHVTESKARSKGDTESTLGVTFDKIDLSNKESLKINGTMQAVGPNLNAGPSSAEGGVGYGGLNQAVEHTTGGTTWSTNIPMLNEQSTGVVGIKGLSLDSAGVLKSDAKAVKLEFGSQVLLRAQMSTN